MLFAAPHVTHPHHLACLLAQLHPSSLNRSQRTHYQICHLPPPPRENPPATHHLPPTTRLLCHHPSDRLAECEKQRLISGHALDRDVLRAQARPHGKEKPVCQLMYHGDFFSGLPHPHPHLVVRMHAVPST